MTLVMQVAVSGIVRVVLKYVVTVVVEVMALAILVAVSGGAGIVWW